MRADTTPQVAAAELVHELEGGQAQVVAAPGQQGFQVLEQGRNHEFIAVAAVQIEQRAAQAFNRARLQRQYVREVFRKQPARHDQRAAPAPLEFFMYLKNSEDGSTTRVSERLLKLCR